MRSSNLLKMDSIGKKFIIPTLSLIIFFLTIFGLFLAYNQIDTITKMIEDKGNSYVQLLDKMSQQYMLNFDTYALEVYVKEVIKNKEIVPTSSVKSLERSNSLILGNNYALQVFASLGRYDAGCTVF